jgi:hypothetical protein
MGNFFSSIGKDDDLTTGLTLGTFGPNDPTNDSSDDSSDDSSNSVINGGKTRRRKKKTLQNKTRGKIQFNKIKWGSFTKIYNNYIKNHPTKKNELPDLKHFAKYVNKHPDQFNKKTHKKALFYTNILTHNG